jgi:hypothetical protein
MSGPTIPFSSIIGLLLAMITNHSIGRRRSVFAFASSLLLLITISLQPVRADVASEGQAAAAANAELGYKYIDGGPDATWGESAYGIEEKPVDSSMEDDVGEGEGNKRPVWEVPWSETHFLNL